MSPDRLGAAGLEKGEAMAKTTGTRGKGPIQVTVSHLIESLKQIEWEARHVRLALQRLDPATKVDANVEMEDHLRTLSKKPNSAVPPC